MVPMRYIGGDVVIHWFLCGTLVEMWWYIGRYEVVYW